MICVDFRYLLQVLAAERVEDHPPNAPGGPCQEVPSDLDFLLPWGSCSHDHAASLRPAFGKVGLTRIAVGQDTGI